MLNVITIHFYLSLSVLVLTILSKLWMLIRDEFKGFPKLFMIQEIIDTIVFSIGLLGVYSYIKQFHFAGQLFWQLFSVIFFLYFILSFWFPKIKWAKKEMAAHELKIVIFISSLLSIPICLVLFYHGFVAFPVR